MQQTPIDGAVARFLVRVLERFASTLTDSSTLRAALKSLGLEASAIAAHQSYVDTHASDIAKLETDLPKLLDELRSGASDLVALIAPTKNLWAVVAGLVRGAPPLPSLPGVDVLGQLLTTAVDRAIRDASTAAWAGLSATGFIGPGTSVLGALDQALGDPLHYLWNTIHSLRRENTLSIASVLTGPRMISMSSVPIGASEPAVPRGDAASDPADTSALGPSDDPEETDAPDPSYTPPREP